MISSPSSQVKLPCSQAKQSKTSNYKGHQFILNYTIDLPSDKSKVILGYYMSKTFAALRRPENLNTDDVWWKYHRQPYLRLEWPLKGWKERTALYQIEFQRSS